MGPAEFAATLPPQRQTAGPDRQTVPFVPPVPTVPQSVLIVDDGPVALETLREMLFQICGPKLRLRHCTQGLEALEVLRRRRFDLVMIDYWLPDMDGLELVSAIADMVDDTAVVLMAHGGTGTLGAEALYRGARHFVDKDRLDVEALEEVILQAWQTARMEWITSQRIAQMHQQLDQLAHQLQQVTDKLQQIQTMAAAMPQATCLNEQFDHLAQNLQNIQQSLREMS